MEKSFKYHNANIHYKKCGSGPAVVLIHGFGEDSRIFDKQVSFLKKDFSLIIPDLPGSGKSGMLIKDREISIGDYARCIKGLFDFEQISSCVLLGHSMGGYITLAFAENYPDMLLAFGLIHSSASADTHEKKNGRRQGIEMIHQYGAFAFLKNTIPNLFANVFKKNHPKVINNLIEHGRQFTSDALSQYYTAMMNREDKTNVLQNSSVPVLFILGKEDTAAPLDVVIKQVELPSISHLHILENVGHMGMIEATNTVNNFLHDFLLFSTAVKP